MIFFRALSVLLDSIACMITFAGLPFLSALIAAKLHETSLKKIKSKTTRKCAAWAIGILIWFVLGMTFIESRCFGWIIKSM